MPRVPQHRMVCRTCDKDKAALWLLDEYDYGLHCVECLAEQEPHGCPFSEEIHGDYDIKCTCSLAKQHECAMDI